MEHTIGTVCDRRTIQGDNGIQLILVTWTECEVISEPAARLPERRGQEIIYNRNVSHLPFSPNFWRWKIIYSRNQQRGNDVHGDDYHKKLSCAFLVWRGSTTGVSAGVLCRLSELYMDTDFEYESIHEQSYTIFFPYRFWRNNYWKILSWDHYATLPINASQLCDRVRTFIFKSIFINSAITIIIVGKVVFYRHRWFCENWK